MTKKSLRPIRQVLDRQAIKKPGNARFRILFRSFVYAQDDTLLLQLFCFFVFGDFLAECTEFLQLKLFCCVELVSGCDIISVFANRAG